MTDSEREVTGQTIDELRRSLSQMALTEPIVATAARIRAIRGLSSEHFALMIAVAAVRSVQKYRELAIDMASSAERSPLTMAEGTKTRSRAVQRQPALFRNEAHFQSEVVNAAKALGWGPIYHTHDSRHSDKGFPDLVMVHQRQRRVVYAELKDDKKKFTPEQLYWHRALLEVCAESYLWRFKDWDVVLGVLRCRSIGCAYLRVKPTSCGVCGSKDILVYREDEHRAKVYCGRCGAVAYSGRGANLAGWLPKDAAPCPMNGLTSYAGWSPALTLKR